eukprot:TRINITY_DN9601_c0_g1_i1.p1 TRINITY_DN9601_c0_g1~~TRINITY_DN9601_c0_g1_i1.p1  ORF type:complete len:226 (-),score=29.53 TRINITY_DN9601_c0_g1_i1:210-887(-)
MSTLSPVAAGSVTCLPLLQQPTLRRARTKFMATQCSTCESQNVSINDIVPSRILKRREALVVALVLACQGLNVGSSNSAVPEPVLAKICDADCERELENIPTTTTSSGLQYKDITVGQGPSPPVGFQVTANYIAMVPSGKVFDSSLEKGSPYIFRVGAGQVIKGLDEGLLSMKVGGVRRLYIPGELAYPKGLSAAAGRPRVPPNSPVVFDVSLLYVPGLDFEDSE